jgi:hypothetical protein
MMGEKSEAPRLLPDPRYKVTREYLHRRLEAGVQEVIGLWLEYDTWLVDWAARHGLSAKVRSLQAPGVICPECRLPLVWDKDLRELRCPNYGPGRCGRAMVDRNEPGEEVVSLLASQRREERLLMHRPKNEPAYITAREPEMVRARTKKAAKEIKAEAKRKKRTGKN